MPINILELNQLEHFFENTEIPKVMMLNKAVRLNDAPKFITETIAMLRKSDGTEKYENPRLWDLRELKKILEAK